MGLRNIGANVGDAGRQAGRSGANINGHGAARPVDDEEIHGADVFSGIAARYKRQYEEVHQELYQYIF